MRNTVPLPFLVGGMLVAFSYAYLCIYGYSSSAISTMEIGVTMFGTTAFMERKHIFRMNTGNSEETERA